MKEITIVSCDPDFNGVYPAPLTKDQLRISDLEHCIELLVAAKKRKESVGKDELYENLKKRGWAMAAELLANA